MGRLSEAQATIERCDKIVLGAPKCAIKLSSILVQEGECEALEKLARHVIASRSEERFANLSLAVSLAAQGKSAAAVRHVLEIDSPTNPHPGQVEWIYRIAVASWEGDFILAESEALSLLREIDAEPQEPVHSNAARWLVDILVETDRLEEAGQVAMAFLDRQDAWEPSPLVEDFAIAADYTPMLLDTAHRAGRFDREEFQRRRSAWMARWEKKAAPAIHNYLWLQGYAAFAYTPENARDALEALPRYSPIPPFRPNTLSWAGIGPAYLLLGQTEAAMPWLQKASRTCSNLLFPFTHTASYFWLGQGLEKKADRDGACAAYQAVLERWGQAKPKSVTADKARARIEALGCPVKP